jgi:hypothetical protein
MRWVVIFLAAFLLTSCISSGPSVTMSNYNFRTGTEGMSISFMKNAPPASVFEEEDFPVYVTIQNKGATDISSGLLALGFQSDYVNAEQKTKEFDLKGKSIAFPDGEQAMLRFLVRSKNIIGNFRTVPITLTGCYTYGTTAVTQVCIDTEVYGINTVQKPCTVSDIKLTGQGGPVAVTKVEPKMLVNEGESIVIPQYVIYVENKGKGTVLRTARDFCSASSLTKDSLNIVQVHAELAEQPLDCNKEELYLEDGKDSVICKLTDGIDKSTIAYSTLLKVQLDYGYAQTATTNINIQKRV